MPQLFKPGANSLAWFSLIISVLGALIAGGLFVSLGRTPLFTGAGIVKEQPVMFSHEHHVNGLGIDCRYCHTSVEKSSFAGLPPTQTCMSCHSQIWKDSPMLLPVRESYRTGRPIPWVRVHDLPDFVYFNHSIHLAKGIGCASCHGPVHKMSLMYQEKPLTMEWCINCHRSPETEARPREAIFKTDWDAPHSSRERAELSQTLKDHYQLKSMTDCTVCHR